MAVGAAVGLDVDPWDASIVAAGGLDVAIGPGAEASGLGDCATGEQPASRSRIALAAPHRRRRQQTVRAESTGAAGVGVTAERRARRDCVSRSPNASTERTAAQAATLEPALRLDPPRRAGLQRSPVQSRESRPRAR